MSRTCFQCEESELLINDKRKEIETLRAKLEKAKTVIHIVELMQTGQQLDKLLFEALQEYRRET